MANALINADYYEHDGVIVKNTLESIQITNPGDFRMDINDAISGGFSDPRNATLMKMFNLINIGERAGSGIPNIFRIWKELSLATPHLYEELNPFCRVMGINFSTAKQSEYILELYTQDYIRR